VIRLRLDAAGGSYPGAKKRYQKFAAHAIILSGTPLVLDTAFSEASSIGELCFPQLSQLL